VDEQVEQKILLQTVPSFYQTWLSPAGDWMEDWPLLVMSYSFEPDRNGNPYLPAGVADWTIWQYSEGVEQGAAYGVGGRDVMLNVFNGTVTEMWEWLEIPAFRIYDLSSGEYYDPGNLPQASGLNSIAFSPDDSYLASGGGRTVSLLNAISGEQKSALISGGRMVTGLEFQPDGRKLAVGTDDGRIFLWDLGLLYEGTEPDPTLKVACSLVSNNLSEAAWQQYLGDTPYHKTCPNLP
jgi:hypothetical protein